MSTESTRRELEDAPLIGLVSRDWPVGSNPLEVGASDELSFQVDVPRDVRLLPSEITLRIKMGGQEGGSVTGSSPDLLRCLADDWNALAFGRLARSGSSLASLGGSSWPRLVRMGFLVVATLPAARLASGNRCFTLGTEAVLDGLERLGNVLALRLPRSDPSVSAWQKSRPTGRAELLALDSELTGRSDEDLRSLGIAPPTVASDLVFPDDLRMAARAVGNTFPVASLRVAMDIIRLSARRDSEAVDTLAAELKASGTVEPGSVPYVGGQAAASWLRSRLAIADNQAVEVDQVLADLGVEIQEYDFGTRAVEAIAAWGDYGPLVVVNSAGLFSSAAHGRRATLAHEVCHLIIDRGGALPVAEATGSAVTTPRPIEQRANAFAAEFLLPRRVAGAWLRRLGDVDEAVLELVARFRVSRTIALYQMKNHPEDAGGPTSEQRRRVSVLLRENTREIARSRAEARRHYPSVPSA